MGEIVRSKWTFTVITDCSPTCATVHESSFLVDNKGLSTSLERSLLVLLRGRLNWDYHTRQQCPHPRALLPTEKRRRGRRGS